MFIGEIYANISVDEGVVAVSANVNIPWQSSKLMITNDSTTDDLRLRLKATQDEITLKPEETLTVLFRTRKIVLNGSNTPYRIWALG